MMAFVKGSILALLDLSGLLLIGYGLWLVYPPLTYLSTGALLLTGSYVRYKISQKPEESQE